TATPTPVFPPLDHFQCYETHRPPLYLPPITLDDRFGPGVVEVKRLKRLCAPADKNGEDPTAPTDVDHLGVYTIKQTSPRFPRVPNVEVYNQFGTQVVDLTRVERLMVPTVKSLTATPPLPSFEVDHFKC